MTQWLKSSIELGEFSVAKFKLSGQYMYIKKQTFNFLEKFYESLGLQLKGLPHTQGNSGYF